MHPPSIMHGHLKKRQNNGKLCGAGIFNEYSLMFTELFGRIFVHFRDGTSGNSIGSVLALTPFSLNFSKGFYTQILPPKSADFDLSSMTRPRGTCSVCHQSRALSGSQHGPPTSRCAGSGKPAGLAPAPTVPIQLIVRTYINKSSNLNFTIKCLLAWSDNSDFTYSASHLGRRKPYTDFTSCVQRPS